jgi:acyl-CoA carboxylase epsilon subunit
VTDAAAPPLFRVVRGNPTAEETAALVAVLAVARAARQAARAASRRAGSSRSGWSDRTRLTQQPLPHGPGAWRSSALPR